MTAVIHPWHEQSWKRLLEQLRAGRLPHALLLQAPPGAGMEDFTESLLGLLLCREPSPEGACGHCRGCGLLAAGSHPDLRRLVPEEEGKAIRIEAIREVIDFVQMSSQEGERRVALLTPAEAMNRNAANSLLKTLEEPPAGAILLLQSHRPQLLPVTVRSRCQRLDLRCRDRAQALAWLRGELPQAEEADELLELYPEAPLRALQAREADLPERRRELLAELLALIRGSEDPVELAGRWQQRGAAMTLELLEGLLREQARDATRAGDLHKSAEGLELRQLFRWYDLVSQARQELGSQNNLREETVLETLTLSW